MTETGERRADTGGAAVPSRVRPEGHGDHRSDKKEKVDGEAGDFARVVVPPPLIFAGASVAGLVLDAIYPVAFLPSWATQELGWPLVGAAGLLAASALWAMRRAGTNVSPNAPSTALVVEGPFRVSRNPVYLAGALLLVGVATLNNALWVLLLLPLALIVVQRGVVAREERYLERRFGAEYLAYKARVRRWV